jgi:poly(A) polymerase
MVGEASLRFRYKKNSKGRLERTAVIYTADEHKINQANVDPLAVYICDRLNNEGYETYIVGGAVRDLLLNKVPKDFDIASAATPSKIKKIFSNSRIIGKRFRLVHVFFGEKIFEIATFRSTEDGADGNTFGTIDDDVKRRDFTMNALFYDPKKQLVVDYVGGYRDISRRRIRPIIPLKVIFEDDPVRMVRAVKYTALSGFSMPFMLKEKIRKQAPLLKRISPSRLTEELAKILKSPHALVIIKELFFFGLYEYLQPKAAKLLADEENFHRRYFASFAELEKRSLEGHDEYADSIVPGLAALVRDYVDDNVVWEDATEASYRDVFRLARKFVLPMNPPRVDLARALRDIFAAHNITVKRWRFLGREMRHNEEVKSALPVQEG